MRLKKGKNSYVLKRSAFDVQQVYLHMRGGFTHALQRVDLAGIHAAGESFKRSSMKDGLPKYYYFCEGNILRIEPPPDKAWKMKVIALECIIL